MPQEELIARLKENIRIFRDSPNVNVTYVDLARLYEDLLTIIDKLQSKTLGFNNKEK